ncbi:MAG: hypothetical protein V9H25_23245 [Candidatus Competibacter sp.]
MTAVPRSDRIPQINSWLLAAIFFSIPTHVAPAYSLSLLLAVLWFAEGNRLDRLKAVLRNRALWTLLAYYALVAASLLWTEDAANGQKVLGKTTFFLLAPLYFSVARKEHFNRYLGAFLAAVALCELLAFYNWAAPPAIFPNSRPEFASTRTRWIRRLSSTASCTRPSWHGRGTWPASARCFRGIATGRCISR